jgi:hypothetical protein
MIELTVEQQQALDQQAGLLRVVDPRTSAAYVLLRLDLFERMQRLLDEDDVRHLEPLLAELAPEDWEDASNYDARP